MEAGLSVDAFVPLKAAADAGHPLAQFELANCYRTGRGVEENIEEANRYYHMAAEQEHCESQFRLGFHYMCAHGFPRDFQMAAKWLALAAEQGHEEAARILNIIRKAA
jgi:TPR repeat protein